jgi:hypothetical protein
MTGTPAPSTRRAVLARGRTPRSSARLADARARLLSVLGSDVTVQLPGLLELFRDQLVGYACVRVGGILLGAAPCLGPPTACDQSHDLAHHAHHRAHTHTPIGRPPFSDTHIGTRVLQSVPARRSSRGEHRARCWDISVATCAACRVCGEACRRCEEACWGLRRALG